MVAEQTDFDALTLGWTVLIRSSWESNLARAKEATFDEARVAARQIQEWRGVEPWSFLPDDWRLLRVTESGTFYLRYAEVGDIVLARKERPFVVANDHTAIFSLRWGSEVVLPSHYLAAL
jgi:hypothetical protein